MKGFLITNKTTVKLTAMILTISLFFSVFWGMPVVAIEDENPEWTKYLDAKWTEAKSRWTWETDTGGANKWDGYEQTEVIPKGTVYEIRTAAELSWMMQMSNYSITYFENKEVKLMNDIDLNGKAFWRIGGSAGFAGTFNGNGKTIFNLYLNMPTHSVVGFISQLMGNGRVINLTISSAKIIGETYVGAVLGWNAMGSDLSDIRVENSWVESTHKRWIGEDPYAGSWAAPIVGAENSYLNCKITRCSSVNNIVYGDVHVSGAFGNVKNVSDSYSVGCTVISTGGHSGGFISCIDNPIGYKNCFVNNMVYGNQDTGVFIGSLGCKSRNWIETITVENCYATGSIEGKERIGGFIGQIYQGHYDENEATNASNLIVKNCYSTAVVGMRNGGDHIGSFIGYFNKTDPAGIRTAVLQNCYAAGEVGGLDETQNKNVGGFVGVRGSPPLITLTNCYYDKQTTTMRETAVGSGSENGVTGLLTDSTKGSASSLKMTDKALTGFDSSIWQFGKEMYPQLKIFSNPDSGMFPKNADRVLSKAYSGASVCTPVLNAWDVIPAAAAYDTLRDVTLDFELTENPDYKLEWTNDGARGAVETSKPVIEMKDNKFSRRVSAIGIDWLTVENTVTENGITVIGERSLRVIPTKSLYPGSDRQISAGRLYDSWTDVALVDASALELSRYYEGKSNIEPITGDETKSRLEKNTAPDYAQISPFITDMDDASYDYHPLGSAVSGIFTGNYTIPESYAYKTFTIEYTWVLADGRYLTGSKTLYVPPVMVHIRQVVLNSTSLAEQLWMGYMRLNQVSVSLPHTPYAVSNIATISGKDSDNPPFTDYRVTIEITKDAAKNGYTVTPVIPQFYEYAGYLVTDTDTSHDASKRVTDLNQTILLDFSDVNELWVTVYIQPTISKPTEYDTDVRINDFGKITLP